MLQVVDHVVRARAHAVAGTDRRPRPGRRAPRIKARLSRLVQRLERSLELGRRSARRAREPGGDCPPGTSTSWAWFVSDLDRTLIRATTPAPGWA